MDNIDEVPFSVGQLAESKSFLKGYRGAWFRCKITNISKRKGRITCFVDFFDYPDDEEKWTQLYQKNIWDVSKFPKERKMELMFRPSFPLVYHESEMLPQATFDTIVLVQDVWKVGDMVDWFCSGCYWSAVVTKILREDKVQVELLQPPMGEGGTYEASSKDLRPSLDWTPEQGWVVPLSNDSEGCLSCARMVQPCKEVKGKTNKYSLLEKSTLTSFPKESFLNKSAAPMPPSGGEEKTDQLLEDRQGCAFFQISSPNPSNEVCDVPLPPSMHPSTSKQKSDSVDIRENGKDKDHIVEYIQSNASCQSPTPSSVNILHDMLVPYYGHPYSLKDTKENKGGTEYTIDADVRSCSLLPSTKYLQSPEVDVSEKIPRSRDDRKADINSLSEASNSRGEPKHTIDVQSKRFKKRNPCSNEACLETKISQYKCATSVVPDDSVESSIMKLEELAIKIRWLQGLLKFGSEWSDDLKPYWKLTPGTREKK